MLNRCHWFAIALLPFVFVTIAGCALGQVSHRAVQAMPSLPSDKPITLSLPNTDWWLEVPATVLPIREVKNIGDRGSLLTMRDPALRLTMSIFLWDVPEVPFEITKNYCRDKGVESVLKVLGAEGRDIKIWESGQLSIMEYVSFRSLKNLHGGYCRKPNSCVHIHISKANFESKDYPLMLALLNSARIAYNVDPLPTAPQDTPSVRSYEIPSQGILELAIPKSWQTSICQPLGVPLTGADVPVITLLPLNARDFKVLISIFWPAKGSPRPSLQEIRALLEEQGKEALMKAVEEKLVFQELRGRDGNGYFFNVTDKDPTLPDKNRPDEYKYWTTGILGVGNWDLQFSILFNRKDAPEWYTALDILKSASLRQ